MGNFFSRLFGVIPRSLFNVALVMAGNRAKGRINGSGTLSTTEKELLNEAVDEMMKDIKETVEGGSPVEE